MKYDFSKIDVFDINEKKIETAIGKDVARLIYRQTTNLDLVDVALRINKGEEVELRPADVKEIRRIIDDPKNGMFAYARKALKDFFESQVTGSKIGQELKMAHKSGTTYKSGSGGHTRTGKPRKKAKKRGK